MKGTLLLLTLLVIGELGFQTTEACLPFSEGYSKVVFAGRILLHSFLSKFDATAEERVALEKIQDCYKEGGLKAKLLDPKIMEAMFVSPECLKYYGEDVVAKITNVLAKLNKLRS